jgi:2-polyprenyl-6-methoxyphenol hydroxylase-like FAD-dependent oxidoreductase
VGADGRWDLFEYVVLHRWSAGRVAIVGDAANAMSPNTGQGAGTAGMNALSLAVFASEAATVEEGLAGWEARERRAHAVRGRRVGCAHAIADLHSHADPPLRRAFPVADAPPPARRPPHSDGSGSLRAGHREAIRPSAAVLKSP